MAHASHIVHCTGPADAHAFDGIPLRPRNGDLDRSCTVCAGHGQWNSQIDLVSHRSIRHACAKCDGRGWIETGDDLVPSHDIGLSGDGRPAWVVRHEPSDDRDDAAPVDDAPRGDAPRADSPPQGDPPR